MLGRFVLRYEKSLNIWNQFTLNFIQNYEKAHNLSFDEYMKMVITSYDADEFERVRERFESDFTKN